MKIKSYFAESIQDAMEKARVELGPDAMLVSSKKVDSELRHLGAYEVVFGLTQDSPAGRQSLRAAAPLATARAATPLLEAAPAAGRRTDDLVQELADLRQQIETVSRSVSRQNYQLRWTGANASPELQELHAQLLAADFSDEMAQDLVRGVQARLQENNRDSARLSRRSEFLSPELFQAALHEEIDERLTVAPSLGGPGERRIVVLVGAPGSGKTTTLVKLAVRQGIAARVPVQILSTDTLRLGGAEQLASYARIIGAGFRAVHSASSLGQAIDEYKTKKLFLIDTPGYDAANIEEASELMAFLRDNPQVEVQLVLPASLRATSAARMLQRFAVFGPRKLLFTRLDEADTPGAVLEPALRSGLPVSFLGKGQQVPEDLEEASKPRLMEKLPAPMRAVRSQAA
jgi:flagellar biosynthesis protein FlhF